MDSTLSTPTMSIHWYRWLSTSLGLLAMAVVTALGGFAADLLPTSVVAMLSGISVFVLLGLLLVRFIKQLAAFHLPMLLLTCLLSGLMLYPLLQQPARLATTLTLLTLCYGLLTLVAAYLRLQFERFNTVLALLALSFSFIGAILVFMSGSIPMQILWTSAAFVCLALLILVSLRGLLHEEDSDYLNTLSGLTLLHIASLMNLSFMLMYTS